MAETSTGRQRVMVVVPMPGKPYIWNLWVSVSADAASFLGRTTTDRDQPLIIFDPCFDIDTTRDSSKSSEPLSTSPLPRWMQK